VKALCLEARGQGGLEEEGAHHIVRGPNHALGLAVLGEVYGQDIRSWTPRERKKAREVLLSNSWPLSHWTALTVRPN
jgi:hypothetical protein